MLRLARGGSPPGGDAARKLHRRALLGRKQRRSGIGKLPEKEWKVREDANNEIHLGEKVSDEFLVVVPNLFIHPGEVGLVSGGGELIHWKEVKR